jgi:hypothetical protein
VGKSLWRKKQKNGQVAGIKAKTQYPIMPALWSDPCWPPDTAFSLIQSGLLNGKSIGFIRLKWHTPSSHEIAAKPEMINIKRIIDEWLLIEYACAFLPVNPEALVDQFSKANVKIPNEWLKPLNIPNAPAGEWPEKERPQPERPPVEPMSITFTPMCEYEKAVAAALQKFDTAKIAANIANNAIARAKGEV